MPNPLQKKFDNLVKSLRKKWKNEYTQEPFLKGIIVDNVDSTLRGISKANLEINFPLTVICGANGSGKTTFSQLATLAFHANKRPKNLLSRYNYYTFTDFFQYTAKERTQTGIVIKYEYTAPIDKSGTTEKIINRRSDRWMRYFSGKPSRHSRPIKKATEFIGLSRIVAAFEKKGAQNKLYSLKSKKISCSNQMNMYLEEILKKPYDYMYGEKHDRSGHFALNDYGSYTSFNCGAGEECIATILSSLLSCPNNSIIVIEEIEIGIHPACLQPLMRVILEIINDKNLQVIITSHSPYFMRCCPKDALVWLKRLGNDCRFIQGPNVEMIVNDLGAEPHKNLYIFCEDDVAETFVKTIISKKEERNLIQMISGLGSYNKLVNIALKFKEKLNIDEKKIFILYDGDVTDDDEKKSKAEKDATDHGFQYDFLPSKFSPEKYIMSKINQNKNFLLDLFGYEEQECLDFNSLDDLHSIFQYLSRAVGNTDNEDGMIETKNKIIDKICRENSSDFKEIKEKIQAMLK